MTMLPQSFSDVFFTLVNNRDDRVLSGPEKSTGIQWKGDHRHRSRLHQCYQLQRIRLLS